MVNNRSFQCKENFTIRYYILIITIRTTKQTSFIEFGKSFNIKLMSNYYI